MKAITIKNPWAHLIAAGIKDVENRSWPTKYRGVILIHSAKMMDLRHREMSILFTLPQWDALSDIEKQKASHGTYLQSAIIGEVKIIDCVNNSKSVWALPNQFHWILSEAKYYDKPVENVKGKLSLWNHDAVLQ
jgi:hypothetical protein